MNRANGGPDKSEWRDRACRAEDRLRRIEPERDDYKDAWLQEKGRADELELMVKSALIALAIQEKASGLVPSVLKARNQLRERVNGR